MRTFRFLNDCLHCPWNPPLRAKYTGSRGQSRSLGKCGHVTSSSRQANSPASPSATGTWRDLARLVVASPILRCGPRTWTSWLRWAGTQGPAPGRRSCGGTPPGRTDEVSAWWSPSTPPGRRPRNRVNSRERPARGRWASGEACAEDLASQLRSPLVLVRRRFRPPSSEHPQVRTPHPDCRSPVPSHMRGAHQPSAMPRRCGED